MIKVINEVIVDRIKSPLLGSFFLSFIWYNFVEIHRLFVNINNTDKVRDIHETFSYNLISPLIFAVVYIVVISLLKILTENFDVLVNDSSKSLSDFLSKKVFNENIKLINELKLEKNELELNILNYRKCLIVTKSNIERILPLLKYTPSEEDALQRSSPESLQLRTNLIVKDKRIIVNTCSKNLEYVEQTLNNK